MAPSPHELTFWDHVGVLRLHLVAGFAVYVLALAVSFAVLRPVLRLALSPLGPQALVFLSPLGPYLFEMRLAMLAALVLSIAPWAGLTLHFVGPALSPGRRVVLWATSICSAGLAGLAVFATGRLLFPLSLRALAAAAIPGTVILPTADAYLDLFVFEALLAIFILELPTLLGALAFAGWLDPGHLLRRRRVLYSVLVIALAVLTPTTDLVSLLIVTLPAVVSLEAGLLVARLIHSRRQRRWDRSRILWP